MKRYCHACAQDLGIIPPPPTGVLTGSQYLLTKFLKHTTLPPDPAKVVSQFLTAGYAQYESYVVSASLSGSVEVDGARTCNIVWAAGSLTGLTYLGGKVIAPADAVKVVLALDPARIHAYPTGSAEWKADFCAKCQGPVLGS